MTPLSRLQMRIKLTNARSRVTTQSDLHSGGAWLHKYFSTDRIRLHLQTYWFQTYAFLENFESYVGYTRGHLYARVDGHKNTSSLVRKHYHNDHVGAVPEDLLSCFKVLKKCMNKFDCLVNEMLYIKQLTPSLNVQVDSIRAKVFVQPPPLCKSDWVVTLDLAFVNFILICNIDSGVMKSPRRREIISLVFTCLDNNNNFEIKMS